MDPSIIKFLEEDEDETMHSGVDMAAFTDALSREIGASPIAAANSAKTRIKKPSVGKKKPLEALGSPPPPSSKKQRVSGRDLLEPSIEQLNDVTAVCGVNLREEEEQLFCRPKEGSRTSDASRRLVQEEENKLILQRIPLQRKLQEIITKGGLKSIGSKVEKALSLCVEERMRRLVSSLIRQSKQRVDIKKGDGRKDIAFDSLADKDARKTSTPGKSARNHHEKEKRWQSSSSPGSIRKLGINQVIMAHNRVARAISGKDVIAILEREQQMSRSTLIYRLYDKIRSESSAE